MRKDASVCMIRYLAVRLAWSIAILFGLSLLFFALEQFTPHGACAAIQPYATGAAQAMAACGRRFGLGQPLPVQYVRVMAHYLQGDIGPSTSTQSLGETLAERRPLDVLLLLGSILVQIPLAIALGGLAALWPRSWFDRVFTPLAMVGRSVPPFWLAVMIGYFPVLFVPWPLAGFYAGGQVIGPLPPFWSHAWFVALAHHPGPILAETLPPLVQAIIVVVAAGTLASALVVRDALSIELHEASALVARAAGLARGAIFRHALRASVPAATTNLAGQFGAMLGAMAVAEYVLPGWGGSLGFFLYQPGISNNPSVGQGLFMVVALVALAGSLLAGILQALLDPRLRDGAAWVPADANLAAPQPTNSLATRLWFLGSVVLLGFLGCLAIFAPLVSPESFAANDFFRALTPPHLAWPWQHGWRYLLGSDGTGHSVLMWVTYGARIPLAVGLLAAVIATCLGLLLGSLRAVPGVLGAWGDLLVRWVSAVLTTPPSILLVFMLTVYLAHGQWMVIALIIGLVSWPRMARVLGMPAVLGDQRQAILVGRVLGVTGPRLLWRGVRPLVGPLINAACRVAALAITLEAVMDFLNVGVSANTNPTWGNAFVPNPSYLSPGTHGPAWWVPFFPGLCILLAALSLTGVGEGLHRLLGSPPRGRMATGWWVFQMSPPRRHEEVTPSLL